MKGRKHCTTASSYCDEDEHQCLKRNRPIDNCISGDSRARRNMRISTPFLTCSVALSLLFLPYRQATSFIVTNPVTRISATSKSQALRNSPNSPISSGNSVFRGLRAMHMYMQPTSSQDVHSIQTFFPAANRIIAIGDVHGDAKALRACLDMAGLVDKDGNWAGGDTHLVQARSPPLPYNVPRTPALRTAPLAHPLPRPHAEVPRAGRRPARSRE
jgi:hypothetical protein